LQDPDQALANNNPTTRPFFPNCANRDSSANDCLAKAINTALGLPFFTHREQLVRLIEQTMSYNTNVASGIKIRGGMPIQALKEPFAISFSKSYNINLLQAFDKRALIKSHPNLNIGQAILNAVKDLMIKSNGPQKKVILLV